MQLLRWQPRRQNTLRGFADVLLPIGLELRECPVHVGSDSRAWAGLPAKPVVTCDRTLSVVAGRVQYAAVLAWRTAERRNAWSDGVVALVQERDPGAFRDAP